ncbi:MAG: mandelate racemase/muconate lactonizing enzyme family protein [Alphaproteobacteria bacterium]|nr:mandelate racemase/muconate lactonizing enzyme family protein [Alphaproteobacteria bacterium]
MKITEVEAIILRQPKVDGAIADGSQDDLIVRVHTDEGIVGIGEVDSAPEVAKAVFEAPNSHYIAAGLRHVLIGQDPLDIEGLWRRMYMGSVYYGRRGVAVHAISGVDIALWDIKGKKLGKPISELLGGKKRDKIRPYASLLMPDTEREAAAQVARLVGMGFTAIKFGWGPIGKDEAHDVRLASAAKKEAGSKVEILIDAGFGYGADADRAIRVARRLEELGIYWLEEPFEPDELEAYAKLADTVGIRVAGGEEDSTRWGFCELVERGHVDVVQPDVTRCGGISEILKIAREAHRVGVGCVPHAWKSGVIKAASLHVNAVIDDATFQEYCVAETPINLHLTREKMPVKDGFVAVPTGPGLGIELDPDILERYAVGAKPLKIK